MTSVKARNIVTKMLLRALACRGGAVGAALLAALLLPPLASADQPARGDEVTPFALGGTAVAPRLQLDTGLCVAFLGAHVLEPAPDRDSVHGNPTEPEEPFLCQLAAGVSYPLAPGAALNLGYRLPNRVLGGVGRNLGLDEAGGAAGEQEISVGVKVVF